MAALEAQLVKHRHSTPVVQGLNPGQGYFS